MAALTAFRQARWYAYYTWHGWEYTPATGEVMRRMPLLDYY